MAKEGKILEFDMGVKRADRDARWDALVKRCADGICEKAAEGAPGAPIGKAAHLAKAAAGLCEQIAGWARAGHVDILIRESVLMALGAVASSMMDAVMQTEGDGDEPRMPEENFAMTLDGLAKQAEAAADLFAQVQAGAAIRGWHGAAMAAWKAAGALDFAACDFCRKGIMKTAGTVAEYVGSGRPDSAMTWPGMTVIELMEDRGIPLDAVAEKTGYPAAYVKAVIDGECRISGGFADALGEMFGIEASFWRNLQEINGH